MVGHGYTSNGPFPCFLLVAQLRVVLGENRTEVVDRSAQHLTRDILQDGNGKPGLLSEMPCACLLQTRVCLHDRVFRQAAATPRATGSPSSGRGGL